MLSNQFLIKPTILIQQIYQCKLLHRCIYYWPQEQQHQLPIPQTTHKVHCFSYIDDVEQEIGSFIEETKEVTNGSFQASCLVLCSLAVREPEVRNLFLQKKLHENVKVLLVFWGKFGMSKQDLLRINAQQQSQFEEYSNSVKYKIKQTSTTIIKCWGNEDENQNILQSISSFFAISRVNQLQIIQRYSEKSFILSQDQHLEERRLLKMNFEALFDVVSEKIKRAKIGQGFKQKVRNFQFLMQCLCVDFEIQEQDEASFYQAVCNKPQILNLWIKSMSKMKESASLRYFEPIIMSIIHNKKQQQTKTSLIQSIFSAVGYIYPEQEPEQSCKLISYELELKARKLSELKNLLSFNTNQSFPNRSLKTLWQFLISNSYKNVEDICALNQQSFLKFHYSHQNKIILLMSEIGKIWMNKKYFHTAIIYYRILFFFNQPAQSIVVKNVSKDSHQNKETRLYLEAKLYLAFCYLKTQQSGKVFGILNELLSLLMQPQDCIKNHIRNVHENKVSLSIGLEFLLLTINNFIYAETQEQMESSNIWKIGLVLLSQLQKEANDISLGLKVLLLQFIILKVSQNSGQLQKDSKQFKVEENLLKVGSKLLQSVVDSRAESMGIKDIQLFCLQTKMQINLLRIKYLQNPQEVLKQLEELREDCAFLINSNFQKQDSFSLLQFHLIDPQKDLPRRVYLSFSQFLNINGENESSEQIKSEFEEIYGDILK